MRYILIGYRHPSCKLYTPKRNRKKLSIVIGVAVTCLVTPCTNWIIGVQIKLLNKYPMWLYR